MIGKKISVMQPTLFPWVGYFDLIDQSDVFVLYNDVQFAKQSWQTRNRISTPNGILLLTIPTRKCELNTLIQDVLIDTTKDWNSKTFKTLQLNYKRAEHYDVVIEWVEYFLNKSREKLADFNVDFIQEVSEIIGIKTEFKLSSELSVESIDRVQRLISITQKLDGASYLSTTGSFDYLNEEDAAVRFEAENISVLFHHYKPVAYNSGKLPYQPYMSMIDMLFHVGFEAALNTIRAGRHTSFTFDEYKDLKNE